jgi:mRNA interferase RelE/StbE
VYTLRYHKRAIKALAKMPLDVRMHLLSELEDIARSPFTYNGDFKQLRGREGWRLRYGKYRVICHISDAELLILVVDAGPRGDIFK